MLPTISPNTILKEAEELYKLIGLDPSKIIGLEQVDLYKLYPLQFDIPQEIDSEEKLHWTRLSINSHIGTTVE